MGKYFKYLFIILLISFIIPQIAFASWWNPFSWNIWNNIFSVFNKPQVTHVDSLIVSPNNSVIAEDASKNTETEQPKTEDKTKTENQTPPSTQTKPVPKSICNPNWQCGDWSNCSNSQQKRSCTDKNNCGDITNKPVELQGCTIACSPNWVCGSWSSCSNSLQTRTCADSNKCGNNNGEPSSTQPCSCTPDWQCSDWNTCSNLQQTRTCADLNKCGTTAGKPSLNQSCTPPPQATIKVYETVDNADGSNGSFPINQDITIKNRIQRVHFSIIAYDVAGNQLKNALFRVTTDDPDLPASFTVYGNGFYVGDHHQSGIVSDIGGRSSCVWPDPDGNDGCIPISIGTFTFTFTQPDLNVSQTIKLTVQ
jgi:hypothetical protein